MEEIVKNSMDKMEEFGKKMLEMKEEMKNTLKGVMLPAFKEFFERHPKVTAIGWTQYTPHFNDGEPCEFSIYDRYFSTIPLGELDTTTSYFEDEEGWISEYDIPDSIKLKLLKENYPGKNWDERISKEEEREKEIDPDLIKAARDLKKFDYIPHEVYQTLGEGKVIVTRKGIDIEEIDHD